MSYCPKCGAKTHTDELFCVSCGAPLPTDISERYNTDQKNFNKWWLVPLSVLIFSLMFAIGIHFYLEHQEDQAKQSYNEGVELALEGQYLKAKDKFRQSLDYKSNYKAAATSSNFMDIAMQINEALGEVDRLIENKMYQEAINLTEENESKLRQYNGKVVNQLLDEILTKRNDIKIAQVQNNLKDEASIDELKMQLWRVESINTEPAQNLESQMKERIVNLSFNEANEELNDNQFSTALAIVKDALRYVPENERLESLKTTIEKQKVAFETEQKQRIAQAQSQVEMEQEQNENNAVELINIEAVKNEEGDIVVKGELKSVATVPIYSTSVKYSLYDENDELILENETFLYPETLYPEETGQFEYTHYDVKEEVDINIDQIKWYLEGQ
ncbi:zinc ribbon domain-containing protein [Filobacillus milosensis]|uniref:Zinc ribbon domain-containing protein n=1 Tax=Filobacillus milosensis TaxID=94137 RepID=A0A4Y8IFZ3_9BACI|nr:zinc ribbon domain-containing protein [Filobacillus milosensis]TFB14067.1 zinc ribbon domain-containing protein [Filobacillus milosensis]